MEVSQQKHKRSWQESHDKWVSLLADPEREKDQLGPSHSKERVECPVEDYVLREDVSGFAKERTASEKATKNTKVDNLGALDMKVATACPRWSDDHFVLGVKSGATSNPFLQKDIGMSGAATPSTPLKTPAGVAPAETTPEKVPESNADKPKKVKDVSRYRTKKYDSATKSFTSQMTEWKKIMATKTKVDAFTNDPTLKEAYKHFVSLATTKIGVGEALLNDTLTSHLASLSDDDKKALPGDLSLLQSTSDVEPLLCF